MTMFTELYALATTATLSMVVSADDKRGTVLSQEPPHSSQHLPQRRS